MTAALLMQPLCYLLWRALRWQFGWSKQAAWAVFLLGNGLLLAAWGGWHTAVRLIAAWLVLLLYIGFTAFGVWLLYRLLHNRIPPLRLRRLLRLIAPLSVAVWFAVSVYNAYTPVVRHYSITVSKPLAQPLRIAAASDLHLGRLVGARQLDKLAEIVAAEKPDVIVLPGDLMDDNVDAYLAENMQPHLAELRAPLGVYATMGNHDLFGDEVRIRAALQAAGIRVLDDEVVEIGGAFSIIGRPDDLDKQRLPVEELLAKADLGKPVILLDHRPSGIAHHSTLPVDIQFSGHAHNGQVLPANLIVRALNRLHYGSEMIGNGHFFVTSGYGFWGVPFRLGSQAEVMIVDVKGL
ncbi:MAG: metallophosphoesterase [Neisseria sp.]|nr:metallophosphoesterase [Neisseria sp.]